MARLDRLVAVKEIAQIGAAIAREFSYSLLHAVVGSDEASLRSALAQLEESELVFRDGAPPEARYSFKHALVQDTAYESLLRSRRQILHQHIAETLCEKFAASSRLSRNWSPITSRKRASPSPRSNTGARRAISRFIARRSRRRSRILARRSR